MPQARICALLTLLLALGTGPAFAADNTAQSLTRFFKGTTRSLPSPDIDFHITAGYAVLRTGKPDSSGRYAMTSINVARVAPDIYRLDLELEKPLPRDIPTFEQPYFFTEKRTYYFWYQNGKRIIFKVGDKKVTLPLGRKELLRVNIHSTDTYTLDRETMLKNLTFDDGTATIHLQLKFK
ncbi:conserved hypothetical protein [Solidesulfovibrio fructosivorans JJ]]|uniref:Uncharacterized protein n=1 Tax=Solidesulfovibrio fructosivorans JJ] TaxID=596151 RepID=E1JXG1_SOLFR|nr:hypothetical protein [Solidesulfovibrio fructosivorans]EFL50938.1 conserved hypothetical protein [Solidesulfovibrio fructosivorans JJ]]